MRGSAVCKPPSQAPQSSWPLFQMRPTSQERPAAWQSFPRTSYFCNKNQKRRGGSGHLWCDQVLGKVAMSANRKKFGLRQPQRTTVLYQHMKNWKCVNKSTISTISLCVLHVKQCKLRKESYCSFSFHLCHLAFHPASGAKVRTASTTLTRLPQVSNLKPTRAEKKMVNHYGTHELKISKSSSPFRNPLHFDSCFSDCFLRPLWAGNRHISSTMITLDGFNDASEMIFTWHVTKTLRLWWSQGYMSQNEHAFCI